MESGVDPKSACVVGTLETEIFSWLDSVVTRPPKRHLSVWSVTPTQSSRAVGSSSFRKGHGRVVRGQTLTLTFDIAMSRDLLGSDYA